MKISIALIDESRDSSQAQENYRLRLEHEMQSWLDGFLSQLPDQDVPFPPAISASLNAGWFHGVTHGRKACFQLETIGEVRQIQAASAEEVHELIGSGKTLETFIKAFSRQEPLPLDSE